MKINDIQTNTANPVVYLTGKGNKTRIVPITSKTAAHCKKYFSEYHNGTAKTENVFYTIIHGKYCPMSPDTAASFMRKYGESAKKICPEIPQRIHPHMLRHTRAIHLYRGGMPLELVSQFLGHSTVETTRIYAFADSEMKREAISKADKLLGNDNRIATPIWKDNDDMILRLSGLK